MAQLSGKRLGDARPPQGCIGPRATRPVSARADPAGVGPIHGRRHPGQLLTRRAAPGPWRRRGDPQRITRGTSRCTVKTCSPISRRRFRRRYRCLSEAGKVMLQRDFLEKMIGWTEHRPARSLRHRGTRQLAARGRAVRQPKKTRPAHDARGRSPDGSAHVRRN